MHGYQRRLGISRSSIYYTRTGPAKERKSRVSKDIGDQVLEIASDRTTYGYTYMGLSGEIREGDAMDRSLAQLGGCSSGTVPLSPFLDWRSLPVWFVVIHDGIDVVQEPPANPTV